MEAGTLVPKAGYTHPPATPMSASGSTSPGPLPILLHAMDDDEIIEVIAFRIKDLWPMVADGRIVDAKRSVSSVAACSEEVEAVCADLCHPRRKHSSSDTYDYTNISQRAW